MIDCFVITFGIVGIFTKRDVAVAEELCFDYGAESGEPECDLKNMNLENRTRCLCGANNCRQYLPFQCY